MHRRPSERNNSPKNGKFRGLLAAAGQMKTVV
jgi:hypothetical protein